MQGHSHGLSLLLCVLLPDGGVRDELRASLVQLQRQLVLALLEVLASTVFQVASSRQSILQSLVIPGVLGLKMIIERACLKVFLLTHTHTHTEKEVRREGELMHRLFSHRPL